MLQYAGVYLLQNYSSCFGRLSHPSSGVHQTVTAVSGTGHSVRATTSRQRGLINLIRKPEGRNLLEDQVVNMKVSCRQPEIIMLESCVLEPVVKNVSAVVKISLS